MRLSTGKRKILVNENKGSFYKEQLNELKIKLDEKYSRETGWEIFALGIACFRTEEIVRF